MTLATDAIFSNSGISPDDLSEFFLGTCTEDRAADIQSAIESNDELKSLLEILRYTFAPSPVEAVQATTRPIQLQSPVLENTLSNRQPHEFDVTDIITQVPKCRDVIASIGKALASQESNEMMAAVTGYRDAAKKLEAAFMHTETFNDSDAWVVARTWVSALFRGREYEECLNTIDTLLEESWPISSVEWLTTTRTIVSVAARLFAFFDDTRKRGHRRCVRKIRNKLAGVMEQLRAASAWLYLPRGDKLIPLFEINAEKRCELGWEEGIVGHVASTLSTYHCDDVLSDPYYVESVTKSKSAVATPILGLNGDLLGVLHLESWSLCGFSAAQAWELQSLANGFESYLISLRELESNDDCTTGWHFEREDLSITDDLNDFCYHVCEVLSELGPRPACVVWNYDDSKNELWVRAADGYDNEFVESRRIPGGPDKSLVGRMAVSPQGSIYSGNWSDSEEFTERDKAERMGLGHIYVCPIYGSPDAASIGVISVYYFGNQYALPDCLIQHITDSVGESIESHELLRPKVAAAQFTFRLTHDKCLSVIDSFSLQLRIILDLMRADAGSIFAHKEEENALVCVATSGLERDGKRVINYQHAKYDLSTDGGMTIFLAKHPGLCVRKNNVYDRLERVGDADAAGQFETVLPQNKYRETMALSVVDHRRFMGIGIHCKTSGQLLGVLRVVRSPSSHPFLKSDEVLFQMLSGVMQGVFHEWLHERSLAEFCKVAKRRLMSKADKGKGETNRAFERLIRPVTTGFGRSRVLVDEVLQNSLVYFRRHKALLMDLREVVLDEEGNDRFRLFEFHSTHSSEPPNPTLFPQAEKHEGCIGWKSLLDWKLLTFRRSACEAIFAPIHEDSKNVKSGAVVPFASWTSGRCVKWVFSLDCEEVVEWTPSDIEMLLHIARKLSAILSDSGPPILLPSDTQFKAFVASGVRAAEADWGCLSLNVKDGIEGSTSKIIAQLGDIKNYSDKGWGTANGEAGEFGARIGGKNSDIFSVPLLFGPYEAGHLTCGSVRRDYSGNENQAVAEIVRLWASLTGFPGTGVVSSWEASFTRHPDAEWPQGIDVWEAVPMYNTLRGSDSFHSPIMATPSDADLLTRILKA